MTRYKAESHLRSIIKGISWRIIAMADTVFIVLLITCLQGRCSIDHAIQIGFAEFLLKLLVYYIHERTWQKALRGGTLTQMKILYKSISWRILATSLTFIISGAILNAYDEIALYIALTELFTKFALYYIHERLWLMLPLGRIRRFSSE
jgi:uncharacterized membrane protein